MKRNLIKTIAMLPTLLLIPTVAFAQITNPITTPSLSALLVAIIDILILIAVPIVVLAIVYAGFLFVTAQGNETKITSAKKILFWSLVGALILFGARVISDIVCDTVEAIASDPTICP